MSADDSEPSGKFLHGVIVVAIIAIIAVLVLNPNDPGTRSAPPMSTESIAPAATTTTTHVCDVNNPDRPITCDGAEVTTPAERGPQISIAPPPETCNAMLTDEVIPVDRWVIDVASPPWGLTESTLLGCKPIDGPSAIGEPIVTLASDTTVVQTVRTLPETK